MNNEKQEILDMLDTLITPADASSCWSVWGRASGRETAWCWGSPACPSRVEMGPGDAPATPR